ncbi:MAG: HAMP domain-containing protein, partial [Thermodesulfobacteriota bacterium]
MKSPRPLFWRLYPSYLLVTLMALLAITLYNSYTLERFYLSQTADDLRARARILQGQILPLLTPLEAAAIDAVCKSAGQRSGTRITVILPDGRVVGDSEENPVNMADHSDRPEILQALGDRVGNVVRYSNTINTRMMYVAVAIQEKGRSLAVVRTSLPVDIIDRKQGTLQFRNLLVGLVVALLAAGVSLYISRRISRPIQEMRKGAEAFAAGDLNYRLPTPQSLEMVRLAQAMNQMAADLNNRIETVIRQRNESEAVLSSMLEGVIAVDPEERVLNINQAAARMFKRDPWHLEGRSIQ